MPQIQHTDQIQTNQPRRPIFRGALTSKYFAYEHDVALGSGAIGNRQLQAIAGDSDFAILKIAALADNWAVKMRLENTPTGEQFFGTPLFLAAIGTGKLPIVCDPPIYLRGNSILTAIFDDRQLIGATNNIFVAYHGLKVYGRALMPPRVYQAQKFFRYVANFTADDGGPGAVAASASQWQSVRVDADSDFEISKIMVMSDGPLTLQISTDSDYWFSTQLRSELLGGSVIEHPIGDDGVGNTGSFPFILPMPRLVTGGGVIATYVTNQFAGSNRIQVVYQGNRLYPAGGVRGESAVFQQGQNRGQF